MSRKEKKAYLQAIRGRYKRSGREKRSRILDEFCAVCGYNRKYAIRVLGKRPATKRAKPGRGKPRYQMEKLLSPLKAIWLATDQMCSKRLKAALPEWLPHYERENGDLEDIVRGQLPSAPPYEDESQPMLPAEYYDYSDAMRHGKMEFALFKGPKIDIQEEIRKSDELIKNIDTSCTIS